MPAIGPDPAKMAPETSDLPVRAELKSAGANQIATGETLSVATDSSV